MSAALTLTEVSKRYGRVAALDGLNLQIPRGVICGLIGPNGAGKTTTFGIMAGLISMDQGRIDVLGQGPYRPGHHKGALALLPQDCQLNADMPILDVLSHLARLQGLSAAEARNEAKARLDDVALIDVGRARLKELSHGMRRRVALAQALLGQPALVLLDEPTSGLDPELVVRMRDLFAAQRNHRTLVISSHNLLELETVCDHVAFIERGRCVRAGSLAEVTQRGLLIRYRLERPVAIGQLTDLPADIRLRWDEEHASLVAEAPCGWSAAQINAVVVPRLMALTVGLLEIRQGQSLEQAYMAQRESPPRTLKAPPPASAA